MLLAQVKANTIEHRHHPRVPKGSVEWPYCLQVRLLKEMESKATNSIDMEQAIMEPGEESHAELATSFDERFCNQDIAWGLLRPRGGSAGSASEGSDNKSEAPQPADTADNKKREKDKETAGHLRRAHQNWDRAFREFEAIHARSEGHPNTTGCRFQQELANVIATGKDVDFCMTELEKKHMKGEDFTDDDTATAAQKTQEMKASIKAGQKLVTSLKSWMRP